MEGAERTAFVNQYTKLVITAWSDEGVMNRLKSDPTKVAKEFGLDVPAGASVKLISQIPTEGDHSPNLDVQLRDWDAGKDSGVYTLHVPETPQIDTEELDELELTTISGGRAASGAAGTAGTVGGDNYCCCCCPCCCCT